LSYQQIIDTILTVTLHSFLKANIHVETSSRWQYDIRKQCAVPNGHFWCYF